jgi:hypothetical protein
VWLRGEVEHYLDHRPRDRRVREVRIKEGRSLPPTVAPGSTPPLPTRGTGGRIKGGDRKPPPANRPIRTRGTGGRIRAADRKPPSAA